MVWDSDDDLLDCQIGHFLGANVAAGELDSDDDATEQTTTEEVGEVESVDEADVKVVCVVRGGLHMFGQIRTRSIQRKPRSIATTQSSIQLAQRNIPIDQRSITITLTSI
jgi:hypothetical protein